MEDSIVNTGVEQELRAVETHLIDVLARTTYGDPEDALDAFMYADAIFRSFEPRLSPDTRLLASYVLAELAENHPEIPTVRASPEYTIQLLAQTHAWLDALPNVASGREVSPRAARLMEIATDLTGAGDLGEPPATFNAWALQLERRLTDLVHRTGRRPEEHPVHATWDSLATELGAYPKELRDLRREVKVGRDGGKNTTPRITLATGGPRTALLATVVATIVAWFTAQDFYFCNSEAVGWCAVQQPAFRVGLAWIAALSISWVLLYSIAVRKKVFRYIDTGNLTQAEKTWTAASSAPNRAPAYGQVMPFKDDGFFTVHHFAWFPVVFGLWLMLYGLELLSNAMPKTSPPFPLQEDFVTVSSHPFWWILGTIFATVGVLHQLLVQRSRMRERLNVYWWDARFSRFAYGVRPAVLAIDWHLVSSLVLANGFAGIAALYRAGTHEDSATLIATADASWAMLIAITGVTTILFSFGLFGVLGVRAHSGLRKYQPVHRSLLFVYFLPAVIALLVPLYGFHHSMESHHIVHAFCSASRCITATTPSPVSP